MTTIATDGNSMAADGRTTAYGQLLTDTTEKLHRLPDGRIFASVGPTDQAAQFARYMREEITDPKLDDDFGALVLSPDGTVYWVGKTLQPVPYMAPMAIGSGGDLALGAMLAGKSPSEAVAIAAQRDMKTGGLVTLMFRPGVEPTKMNFEEEMVFEDADWCRFGSLASKPVATRRSRG